MSNSMNVLMVAAENDALPDCKVGGIADVVRDIPLALAGEGCKVNIVLPDYGHLAAAETAVCRNYFTVPFKGDFEHVALYQVEPKSEYYKNPNIAYWVITHPYFQPCGAGKVYCHDSNSRPFATDASKYAFFCAAVAQIITHGGFGNLDILHLHDWHAALLAVLRAYDSSFSALRHIHTVYTIHNLALQGVRPLSGDESSLEVWFPHLRYDMQAVADPRYPDCINPVRAAIVLADKVHAVSPSYAQEIQQPSQRVAGIYGGEGLESDLRCAAHSGRLHGILNGCEYPPNAKYKKLSKLALVDLLKETVMAWIGSHRTLSSFNWLALNRLDLWLAKKERGMVVTSVGRITDQKIRLLKEPVSLPGGKSQSLLDCFLDQLKGQGVFILLGSGQETYEDFLLSAASRHDHFIFLKGFAAGLAERIYTAGDLFLMPSSFEPCGISQMLAMRAGQPCLVNAVGGLRDTVKDNDNGFVFDGAGSAEQSADFLEKFSEALSLYKNNKKQYKVICDNAKSARFTWHAVAKQYIEKLYA